jgi:predicted glycogen debranching enzyme
MDPILTLAPGLCRNRDATISREWLVTNGIGGYAMGTVAGANTRAYHGYLVAATTPPVGRTLLLQHLDERIISAGQEWPLSADEWADGSRTPLERRNHPDMPTLAAFALDGTLPVWTYALGRGSLEKRVWMAHGQNTTYVRYTLLDSVAPVCLRVQLGVNDRDHHGRSVADGTAWQVADADPGWTIVRDGVDGAQPWLLLTLPSVSLAPIGTWSTPIFRRVEAERGLDAVEQRYVLGLLELELAPGASWTLICSTDPLATIERDPLAALEAEQRRQAALIAQAKAQFAPLPVRQLVLAADQFIVERTLVANDRVDSGQSVIAGYPWFGDWGRDTMISLPGLCLTTGRYDVAARILRTFARYVSQGMLPNRFPDAGEEPEYNTVDATLWYFHAIERYDQVTDDAALLADLYPVLADIIAWHLRGTRYGIQVDPADGLLRSGEPGAQLTWMDIRIDVPTLQQLAPDQIADCRVRGIDLTHGLVVTPRHGKAVEINALWYHALRLMAMWAPRYGGAAAGAEYAALSEQARASFQRFWYAAGGYLYDVIDTPGGDDTTLRPNQIVALSIAPELLPETQRRAALAQVARHLWTPVGLRTLDPRDPDYQPRFTGNRVQRDSAYHQGTIWPWLIGHYLDARRQLAPELELQPYVAALLDQLWDGGLGTVAEVFDGDPPRAGAGCMAQAWSVAELLRIVLPAHAALTGILL